MAREFLVITDVRHDGIRLEMELKMISKLLPYIESFKAFVTHNDIWDIRNHKFVLNRGKIKRAVAEGLGCSTKYCVFCRN